MHKNSDGTFDLFHLDWYGVIQPSEKWIGLRSQGSANNVEQAWRERKGKKQRYQLNLLPCVTIVFDYTKWTSTKKEKKKK